MGVSTSRILPRPVNATISPDTWKQSPTSTSRRFVHPNSSLVRHQRMHRYSPRDSTMRSSGSWSFSWEMDHLTRRLTSRSNILPLSTLCISCGRAVWCLYIDATCLNYDGNAFDAALVAIIAALGNSAYARSLPTQPHLVNVTLAVTLATLPQATFDPDTTTATCSRTIRVPLSLNKNRRVVGLSFGCVGGRSLAVLCLRCSPLT